MTAEGPGWKSADEVFKGKKVVLFAVPGPSHRPVIRIICRASCKTAMPSGVRAWIRSP